MKAPALFVADAGQAYEVLPRPLIRGCLDRLFDAVRKAPCRADPCVQVLHTPQCKVSFGGRIDDTLDDRTVLFLSRIAKCIYSMFELRLHRLGSQVLVHQRGIPIGGPLSGDILKSVLAEAEHMRSSSTWNRFSHMGLRGTRRDWLTLVRYIDDLCGYSQWLCQACVQEYVDSVYRDLICFEAEPAATFASVSVGQFLDFCVCAEFGGLTIGATVKMMY